MEQSLLKSMQYFDVSSNQEDIKKLKSREKSRKLACHQQRSINNSKDVLHRAEHVFSAHMTVKVEHALISECQSHLHRNAKPPFDQQMIAEQEPKCTAGDFQGRKALKLIKKNFKKHRAKGKSTLVQLSQKQEKENDDRTFQNPIQRNSTVNIIIKNVQNEIYEQNRSSEATPSLMNQSKRNIRLNNENNRRWSLDPRGQDCNNKYNRNNRSKTNLDKFVALSNRKTQIQCPNYPIPLEDPPPIEPEIVRIYRIREAGRIPKFIETFIPKKKKQIHHSNESKVVPTKLAYSYEGKLIQMEEERKKPVTDPKYIQCQVKVSQQGKITDGKELIKSKHRQAINPFLNIDHVNPVSNVTLINHPHVHFHQLAEQGQSPFLESLQADKLKAPTSKYVQINSQKSVEGMLSTNLLDCAMDGKKVNWIKWERLAKRKKGKSLNQTEKSFYADQIGEYKILGSKQFSKSKSRTNSLNCMISKQNNLWRSYSNTLEHIPTKDNEISLIKIKSSNHQISFNKNKVGLLFEQSEIELINSQTQSFPNKIVNNTKINENTKNKEKLLKKNIKSVKFDFDSNAMKKKTSSMNQNFN